MKTKKILAALLCLAAANVYADDIYERCTQEAGMMNNAVVYECSERASAVYKKQINLAYRKIHTALQKDNPEAAQKFENSQKAWLAYRNQHCELAGQYIGSPMSSYCPMELNQARSAELQELAESF
ncbi:DUF1311 domain-containing protein [Neisseria sp. ZJ106]|uniref:Lysozyme inhibitor LprI family protein n=1 Tax=Neisseria lisongii TaxID=2912188 RepID=A0ABY7RJL3_9NEIS|nr:lysozyme inhibitor LprI family protein [Neisseria lisongii]MCF7520580.1 DUF1311 domain-containing protein [Neisseria lisongii]WCL71483.1 lysozyme inhibitor LprI family protein [Neisseria lisongii]